MSYTATSPSLLCSDFSSLPPPRQSYESPNSYNNYTPSFAQDTGYDRSNILGRSSGLISQAKNSSKSSSQIEAFGSKFLSAIAENVTVPAAVAATATNLSRKSSLHARARSLASYVPSLNSSLVEEQRSPAPTSQARFGGLFRGASIRRASTIPREEEEEDEESDTEFIMEYKPSLTGGPDRTPEPAAQQKTTRKFSWFGTASKETAAPASGQQSQDGTISLDLLQPATSLLFPLGAPDSSSPTAFPELLRNAETLITRLQTAYKTQASSLHAAQSELSIQAEETEESATRAQHLKLQLEAMAQRANEQDAAMRALAAELATEKQRRADDRERFARQRQAQNAATTTSPRSTRSYRHSGGSELASDSGFESDVETASSCSRPMTPLTPSSAHGWTSEAVLKRGGGEVRPLSSGSMTARMPGRTCEVDSGVWMFMREEKARLERRVAELEGAVEGALALVGR
ncbi:hypothetical protein MBLNU459_g5306t1 [Dothideomycetes sp. NU459]